MAQRLGDAPLTTADGMPVRISTPGRPGGRAGPDFRDAVVQFGDEPPLTGDVELHRDARDFVRHGHAADPAYDRVVLHVAFTANDGEITTLASGGHARVLTVPAGEGGSSLPLREPCTAATGRLGATGVRVVLREGGVWRLRRKTDALQSVIERDGAGQALYAALAVALGQTANASAFALLAEHVPLATVAAGTTGFTEHEVAGAIERRLLHAAGLDGALLTPAPALPWVIGGQRPAAHPARRIAALARIVARLSRPDLATGAWGAATGAATPRALIALLTVAAIEGPALCGRARAVELAVNALIPWAAARATLGGDEDVAGTIMALAGDLPVAERYGSVAHLERNLRDSRGRTLISSALLQQGSLALLREWCRRGGCGRCPLS